MEQTIFAKACIHFTGLAIPVKRARNDKRGSPTTLWLDIVLDEHGDGSASPLDGDVAISFGEQSTKEHEISTNVTASFLYPEGLQKDVMDAISLEIENWVQTATVKLPTFLRCMGYTQ